MTLFVKRTFGVAQCATLAVMALSALAPSAARADDHNSQDTPSRYARHDQGNRGYQNRHQDQATQDEQGRRSYQSQGDSQKYRSYHRYRSHANLGSQSYSGRRYQGSQSYSGRRTGSGQSYHHDQDQNGSQTYQGWAHRDRNTH